MNIFQNKIILITGGTGSFGNAFLSKIIKTPFKEIRIFSRDEKKQNDLRNSLKKINIKFYIGDIRDKSSVFEATRNVDYIFHAAALKQVPSCEFYPLEAIKTNILGTQNVLDCAVENNVKKVICLSTDKAVYPINAMGMSKALMEKIAIAKSRNLKNNKTDIMVTRYGNVLFSRGSVLPLFINQIIKKDFITITDPNMTRFLMSLDEAIDLVLFALIKGKNGHIYIPKTPAASIKVIAEALLNLYQHSKSRIKIIGTRHGEKTHETLMSREELFFSKKIGKRYFSIKPDNRELNYDSYFKSGKIKISKTVDYTSKNTDQLSLKKTIGLLKPLINNLKIY
jgi:UDP-N-acetylglucosamine 4,6-dehydratase